MRQGLTFLLLVLASNSLGGEKFNYQVDRAALAAQDRAITKLKAVAERFKGNYRQQLLLKRLVEAQGAAAKIEFRLAHARSQIRKRKLSLKRYHRRLEAVIASTTQLIVRFPQSQWLNPMILTRSKAYKELGQKEMAKRDLIQVSQRSPGTEWAVQANLGLGELAIEDGNYQEAIGHLKPIEAMPRDPRYPFALYQIGWAYFNLDQVPQAITALQRQIRHYREKQEANPLSSADQALKEQSLRDLVSFVFSRLDKGDPEFPLGDVYSKMESWEDGPYLGKMTEHFTKLLISRDRVGDLAQWVEGLVEEKAKSPESLESTALFFEYTAEKRNSNLLARAQQALITLKKENGENFSKLESYPATMERILQAATNIQGDISGKKKKSQVSKLHQLLTSIYRTYEQITTPQDPKLIGIKANLAEVDFAEKRYALAAKRFRWLAENGGDKAPLSPAQASLKALIADYQVLEGKQQLPKGLEPKSPTGDDDAQPEDLPSGQRQWVTAVYQHLDDYGRKPADFVTFEFEAYRMLYSNGQTRAALEALTDMVREQPTSPVALPAANLVLDSYLISGGEKALAVVDEFRELKGLGKKAFRSRLTDVPAEVSYRLIEKQFQEKNFAKALSLGETYLQDFKSSPWAPEVLWVAARSSLELGKKDLALRWLNQHLSQYPKAENRGVALLGRAEIEEQRYRFDEAARDYNEFFQLPGRDSEERRAVGPRLFLTTWLSKAWRPLDCTPFKGEEIHTQCEHTQALTYLHPRAPKAKRAENLARKGKKENRPAWAAVALRQRKLSFHRTLSFSRTLTQSWGDQDPLVQFSLIPVLNQDIPDGFRRSQKALPRLAPLKSDTKALVRRINLIKKFEDTAGQVIDVPWGQVKISVLGAVGETYRDFCQELVKLPTPADLSPDELTQYRQSITEVLTPFGEKRDTLLKQVKTLSASSPIRSSSPGLERKPASHDLSMKTLQSLFNQNQSSKASVVQGQWLHALSQGHWGRVGYFLRELKETYELPKQTLTLMRSIALHRAGAHAEAIAEMEEVRNRVPRPVQAQVQQTLKHWYLQSTQPKKAAASGKGKSS